MARNKIWEGWWRWALISPDVVAPSRMIAVSASVYLPLHHKVQKFSSGTSSPGWSQKKGCKTAVVVVVECIDNSSLICRLTTQAGRLAVRVSIHNLGSEAEQMMRHRL